MVCDTQLLEFSDELVRNLSRGLQTDILIIDFGKAFGKVNRSLLVHKLDRYGIRGRIKHWIADFLSGRRQAFVVNGDRSN